MELIANIKRSKAAGVELKNYRAANSMDGRIWSADLYLNSRKVGELVDHGHGHVSSNTSDADVAAVIAALKAAGYLLDTDVDAQTVDESHEDFAYFEGAVGYMAIEVEELKSLKKATSKTTHFVRSDDKTYIMKFPFDAETAALIRASEGDRLVCIINEELAAL